MAQSRIGRPFCFSLPAELKLFQALSGTQNVMYPVALIPSVRAAERWQPERRPAMERLLDPGAGRLAFRAAAGERDRRDKCSVR
ncbi:MAG: hypothetical protein R2834_04230 [Rhodothermales bacterium]